MRKKRTATQVKAARVDRRALERATIRWFKQASFSTEQGKPVMHQGDLIEGYGLRKAWERLRG
jgi:hypothetical protein